VGRVKQQKVREIKGFETKYLYNKHWNILGTVEEYIGREFLPDLVPSHMDISTLLLYFLWNRITIQPLTLC